jgi:uncharacterized protein (TIGR02117 family)
MALSAPVALYLLAALVGSLVPVNRGWTEPAKGTTVYLIDNGIHTDLIMPIEAQGLSWAKLLPRRDFEAIDENASFVAFGAGEERVYLETPTWWDLKPRTVWSALTGGKQVIHVQYVPAPASDRFRQVKLRPEEYRRLWAAVRAGFALDQRGRPQRIDHPGYGPSDAFYRAAGKASVVNTCNSWVAELLRLAGVKTSLWAPFAKGLLWRYSRYSPTSLL